MKLFITGLKHSGKSTFAPMIAKRLNLISSDSDDLILALDGVTSVREYFKSVGSEGFKQTELNVTGSFIENTESFVLSLGGGVADNLPLMTLMKESGKIIYLRRDEKILLERILLKGGVPPFLDPNDVEGSFHTLFVRRSGIYEEYADLTIDLGPYSDKEETCERIMAIIRRQYGL